MDTKDEENIAREIIKPNLDLGIDYGEIALDEFLGNGLLKDIPIVKTLVAVVKTGVAIKERFFVKKFLVFLQTLHSNQIENDELEKFKKSFEGDKKYRDEITDQLLILVEQIDSIKKAKILAHLFRAHIEGVYKWERFIALSKCLDKIQEVSYPFLDVLSKRPNFSMSGGVSVNEVKKVFEDRGENFDDKEGRGLLIATGIVYESGTYFSINKLGQDLYNYGISKIEHENDN